MQVLLFHVHLVPASKYVQAIPGKQFFLSPVSTSVVKIYFQETCLLSLHQLLQYHLDHHSMQPNGMDLCLRKIMDGCTQEQTRENQMVSGERSVVSGYDSSNTLRLLHVCYFRNR